MTFAPAVPILFTSFVYRTNVYWSVIHGIKRKPHLSVVWNWYHFVAIAILHQPRPTDSADINRRLQRSDTSSIPPMHGGFSLISGLTLNVRGPSYLGLTRSISWLLMPWLLASPGHQQPWNLLCRMGRFMFYLKKNSNYLFHISLEEIVSIYLCFLWKRKGLISTMALDLVSTPLALQHHNFHIIISVDQSIMI